MSIGVSDNSARVTTTVEGPRAISVRAASNIELKSWPSAPNSQSIRNDWRVGDDIVERYETVAT